MEEWREIRDFPDYQVSNLGRVKNSFGKVLFQGTVSNGYKQIRFQVNKIKTYKLIHKIVAETFIPNPENKPCIDHINRDKTDNRVCNLRWATWKENANNRPLGCLNEPYITLCRPTPSLLKRGFTTTSFMVQLNQTSNKIRKSFKTLEEAITFRDKVLSQNITDES